MNILESFYKFLGGGNVVQGSRYFDYVLIALAGIVIILIAVAIIISVISSRKLKNVSLKSVKSEKIREKRARGVFNYDSEGRFIADEDEDEDDGSTDDPKPDKGRQRKRRKADNRAVIDMMRRSHSDHDDDRSIPQVSLKPVSARKADNHGDDTIPMDMDDADENTGMNPAGGQRPEERPESYAGAADQRSAPVRAMPPAQPASLPRRMQNVQQPHAVSMPRAQTMPSPSPGMAENAAPSGNEPTAAPVRNPAGSENRNPENGSGSRHARHARNPFSRPVSADDMERGSR